MSALKRVVTRKPVFLQLLVWTGIFVGLALTVESIRTHEEASELRENLLWSVVTFIFVMMMGIIYETLRVIRSHRN